MYIKNIILLFFFTSITSFSQVININPNKTAAPWLVGGLRLPSQEELDQVKELEIPQNYQGQSKNLPVSLDNSQNIHFPPVFSQTGGSCAQASGITYTFTYAINRLRGTAANIDENIFPSHYTYNFLNSGSENNGSWYFDGWRIIEKNGCPTVATYGGIAANETFWMSGYEKYASGMEYRVKGDFGIYVGNPQGLQKLKYYLSDHLDGSDKGGIVNFAAGVTGEFTMNSNIISRWGSQVNHAMTIVGWDDTIKYDYNNDGQYTNDVDINNDGIVDMKDWEIGALIMVNSWGTYWGNQGRAYIMYKTLAESPANGGIYMNSVHGIKVKADYEPQLLFKVKMKHSARYMISVFPGISSDLTKDTPDYAYPLPIFTSQGGDFPMRGIYNNNPIEFSLDVTPLLEHIESGEEAKFFLIIRNTDFNNQENGDLIDFSMIDNEGNEYTCNSHNVNIDEGFNFYSITANPSFSFPVIETNSLPIANSGSNYSFNMEATGGSEPYEWNILLDYTEESNTDDFPNITTNELTPTDNDDGFVSQDLAFDFPFYGDTYNNISISTDGSILFEPNFLTIRSEEAINNHKVISPYASDLIISNTDQGIFFEGDDQSASIRWKAETYEEGKSVDVVATLHKDGSIQFFYGVIDEGIDWASGISDGKNNYLINSISGEYAPENLKSAFQMPDYPMGITLSENGLLEGIVNSEGSWDLHIKVTDNNLVSDDKILILSTAAASVSDFNITKFQVYPNPNQGNFNLTFEALESGNLTIQILDLSGRIINEKIYDGLEVNSYKFEISENLKSGLYFAKIIFNDSYQTKKILVN